MVQPPPHRPLLPLPQQQNRTARMMIHQMLKPQPPLLPQKLLHIRIPPKKLRLKRCRSFHGIPEAKKCAASALGDGLDLAEDALGQILHSDAAAGRLGNEELGVNFVECCKISDFC